MQPPSGPESGAPQQSKVSRPLVLSVGSQSLSAVSNAFVSLVASFALTSSEFGAMSLALIVYRLTLMTTDGAVGSVLLVRIPRLDPDSADELASAGRRATLASGLVVGLIAIGLSISVLRGGPLAAPFLTIGIFLPPLLLHETLRVQAFAIQRPIDAVWGDAVWVGIGGPGVLALALLVDGVSSWQLLAVWSAGALAGAWVMRRRLSRRKRGAPMSVRQYFSEHRRLAGAFLTDNVVSVGSVELASVAVSAGLGIGALGRWRTSSIVFSPLDPIRAAVISWAVPRATSSGQSQAGVRAEFRRLGITLGVLTAVLAVPLGVLAMKISDVSGDSSAWANIQSLIVPAAILTVARAFSGPFAYLLRIEERSSAIVRLRLLDGVSLVIAVGAAATVSLTVVAWTIAIQRIVMSIVWFVASQHPASLREAATDPS